MNYFEKFLKNLGKIMARSALWNELIYSCLSKVCSSGVVIFSASVCVSSSRFDGSFQLNEWTDQNFHRCQCISLCIKWFSYGFYQTVCQLLEVLDEMANDFVAA